MTTTALDDATMQLDVALVAEARARDCHLAARGHARRSDTFVALRAASDQVAARQTTLTHIDEDRVGNRVTVNGREVGGAGSIFA